MTVTLYILAVLAVTFVMSGALPRYVEWRDRAGRAQAFESKYRQWVEATERFDGYDGYGLPDVAVSAVAQVDVVGRTNTSGQAPLRSDACLFDVRREFPVQRFSKTH